MRIRKRLSEQTPSYQDTYGEKSGEASLRNTSMKNIKWIKRIRNLLIVIAAGIFLLVCYRCPFRFLFGISCPGCGMTRAFGALLTLDLKGAFRAHPLFPVVIVMVVGYLLEKAGRIRLTEKSRNCVLVLTGLLFVAVYLLRLRSGSDIVRICPQEGIVFRLLEVLQEHI